jgi:16S rRNA (uracil1498-N3)-methyltransferase
MASKLQRLFVQAPLAQDAEIAIDAAKAHYLTHVLRLKPGDSILLFNGEDGEWRAELFGAGKGYVPLRAIEQTRSQQEGPDLVYAFSPLKRARLDYMAQKATELGANRIQPVIMRHTIAERVKAERLAANAVEAAEQCGILRVPEVVEPVKLPELLQHWESDRLLVFADEQAEHGSAIEALRQAEPGKLGVLIGPEGGFHADERALLLEKPFVLPISLGPRIMRADTAGVAALALVNAVLGDWR